MIDFSARHERLRRLMKSAHIDALLITDAASRYYLSGFELHDPQCNESAGVLIFTLQDAWLCTDSRYFDAAKRVWDENHIFIYQGDSANSIGTYLKGKVFGAFGFNAENVSLGWWERFSRVLSSVVFVRTENFVVQLRAVKDSDEILKMRASCALNESMMQWIPQKIEENRINHVEMTESSIAWDIEKYFREYGAEELAFPSIVAANANGALPHAIPSSVVSVNDGSALLVDAGCRLNSYCSDQTRVFWSGDHPSEMFLRTRDRVQEAQRRAVAQIRAGITGKEAYMAAWRYFESEGCEKAFTHSLGHGVGLETHEFPSLSPRNEKPLEEGMVVTVEPGLYYPGWGGIRWEVMVVVRNGGCEIL